MLRTLAVPVFRAVAVAVVLTGAGLSAPAIAAESLAIEEIIVTARKREESAQEDTRLIDLAALVESLCDDLSDTGQPVSFSGPTKAPYRCRSVSLKRALGNLVENAVTYGKRARVALIEERNRLCIDIDDDGPGIAEAAVAGRWLAGQGGRRAQQTRSGGRLLARFDNRRTW